MYEEKNIIWNKFFFGFLVRELIFLIIWIIVSVSDGLSLINTPKLMFISSIWTTFKTPSVFSCFENIFFKKIIFFFSKIFNRFFKGIHFGFSHFIINDLLLRVSSFIFNQLEKRIKWRECVRVTKIIKIFLYFFFLNERKHIPKIFQYFIVFCLYKDLFIAYILFT